jgi:hypothetical protein
MEPDEVLPSRGWRSACSLPALGLMGPLSASSAVTGAAAKGILDGFDAPAPPASLAPPAVRPGMPGCTMVPPNGLDEEDGGAGEAAEDVVAAGAPKGFPLGFPLGAPELPTPDAAIPALRVSATSALADACGALPNGFAPTAAAGGWEWCEEGSALSRAVGMDVSGGWRAWVVGGRAVELAGGGEGADCGVADGGGSRSRNAEGGSVTTPPHALQGPRPPCVTRAVRQRT